MIARPRTVKNCDVMITAAKSTGKTIATENSIGMRNAMHSAISPMTMSSKDPKTVPVVPIVAWLTHAPIALV